ncbi:MAG: 30S ribosomal protein S3 [Christensenella sp.]|nr:30S ribosomal protein S3 [Christensenella sp.]
MGQKVNPNGFRVGVIKDWNTRWYASKKDFADFLVEDRTIRDFVKKKYFLASISRIEIDRAAGKITVSIFTARPGLLIGKGGTGIEVIKEEIKKATGKDVSVNIMEIRDPDADAQLVAENIASQLEKRISFRRALKQAMGRAMQKNSVKGIKLMVSGRLGGAEIARSEGYHDGSIPLQTMRADIQYGFAEAKTTYGRIGCKVWIYKGELLGKRGASDRREEGGK